MKNTNKNQGDRKMENLKEAQAYIEQLLTEKGELIIAAAKSEHARKVAEEKLSSVAKELAYMELKESRWMK